MNESFFSFLDNIELSEVIPKQQMGSSKVEKNPTEADIRVFADGAIYPSEKLVEEFNLEYQSEGSDIVENGFDLIDTALWGMLPKDTPRFLAIATVNRASARKPMLFGKYRMKDGKPVHSVMSQGSISAGKTLLSYLDVVLGVEMGDEPYLDLKLVRERKLSSNNGIYNLPYVVAKGKEAGVIKSVRRENCEIYPLIVVNTEPIGEEPQKANIEEVPFENQ